MKTLRIGLALLSWGATAVMMHPSFASLLVILCNAGVLALLLQLPRPLERN